jgi:hypothetical protein
MQAPKKKSFLAGKSMHMRALEFNELQQAPESGFFGANPRKAAQIYPQLKSYQVVTPDFGSNLVKLSPFLILEGGAQVSSPLRHSQTAYLGAYSVGMELLDVGIHQHSGSAETHDGALYSRSQDVVDGLLR